MSTRKIDQIKDQARRLLSEEEFLTAIQLASLATPPISTAAMSIALNELYKDGDVRHVPGNGWTLSRNGGDDDADAA